MSLNNCSESEKETSNKGKKRVIIGAVAATVVVAIAAVCIYIFGIKVPRDKAYQEYVTAVSECNSALDNYNATVQKYNDRVKSVIALNDELDATIKEAQGVVDCGDEPYEGEKITTLNNTLKDARNQKVTVPEIMLLSDAYVVSGDLSKAKKSDIELAKNSMVTATTALTNDIRNIETKTESIVIPDYLDIVNKIDMQKKELEESYAIQKQIMSPAQDWVITRLGTISDIAGIAPVTEEHDPNGNLNKAGGYTATIYFGTALLGTQDLFGDAVIDEGTDGGGAVEVYASVEDATRRDSYLANFDGTGYASGSHKVLGTMVLRTSNDLKASQQETLTNAMVAAMIRLD